MAQEAVLRKMADSTLLRILDRNQHFEIAATAVGDSAILYKQIGPKGIPVWRGPAIILDIDDTGTTAKF